MPGTPTTSKLRILCGSQQMLRLDSEVIPQEYGPFADELLKRVFALLPDADVVVLSDYAKGVLTESVCRAIIDAAHEFEVPVLVDPKSRNFTRYRGATTICPNLRELAVATGESPKNVEAVLLGGQALLPWLRMKFMAVTLGEKGIAVLHERSRGQIPAVVRQVFDVSGAGDTVIAVLALALASQVNIETAAQVANLAAGIVVGKTGTVPIYRHELLAALTQDVSLAKEEKVLSPDRLLWRVSAWRAAGQRVVFTNGCFDLLHVGHISLLEGARRKGDRLIVAINSDDSVRRLKGEPRPLVAFANRARIIAALHVVDAVVVFDDDTPLALIEAIRPEVLVKGGDYTEDEVVGAAQVRSWGGIVELIPIVEGASTTGLVEKAMLSTAMSGVGGKC
jgi:D-beta-D-heptose 7-phosphate kinase/D-beta-D-heptose 1-phosphate adenosyltransferase